MRFASLSTILVLALAGGAWFAGCGDEESGGPTIILALARGGLGDQAFNDSANAGLQRAAEELDAEVSTVDFVDGDAQLDNLRDAADQEFDLFIAIGAENAAALATIASENPEESFAIIDAPAEGSNVTSITFSELEGDYLAGALSALLSTTGSVAFLGGADIEVIRRVEHGWRQGVLAVDPDAEMHVEFVAGKDDFSGFANPDEAESIALELYDRGAGILYAAAGGSTLGAIEAARTAGSLIITTGTDQRHIAPEAVVTSRIKDMGAVVFMLATEANEGEVEPGSRTLDYHSGAIALAPYDGPLVPPDVLAEFDAIVQEMQAGSITVIPFEP